MTPLFSCWCSSRLSQATCQASALAAASITSNEINRLRKTLGGAQMLLSQEMMHKCYTFPMQRIICSSVPLTGIASAAIRTLRKCRCGCISHATSLIHAWHVIARTFRQHDVKKGGASPLFNTFKKAAISAFRSARRCGLLAPCNWRSGE